MRKSTAGRKVEFPLVRNEDGLWVEQKPKHRGPKINKETGQPATRWTTEDSVLAVYAARFPEEQNRAQRASSKSPRTFKMGVAAARTHLRMTAQGLTGMSRLGQTVVQMYEATPELVIAQAREIMRRKERG